MISAKYVDDSKALLAELKKSSPKQENDSATPTFDHFTEAVLQHFPIGDWLGREIQHLSGAFSDFFEFVQQRRHGDTNIRIYTPTEAIHGWETKHSVLLIASEDLPFLIDSIRMVLERDEYTIHIAKSTIIECHRVDDHLQSVQAISTDTDLQSHKTTHNVEATSSRETFAYFEITLERDTSEVDKLRQDILDVVKYVKSVVSDYQPMLKRLDDYTQRLQDLFGDTCEEIHFLQWLRQSNFTFLGMRELYFDHSFAQIDGKLANNHLIENADKRLGLFTTIDCDVLDVSTEAFSSGAVSFYSSQNIVCFSKSRTRSSVHRDVYPDYIVFKTFNEAGELIGELRFLGFYTYAVSSLSPQDIPILRKKIDYVLSDSGLNTRSHDGKRLLRYIDLHPKEELFQASQQELLRCFQSILTLNERHAVRLVTRVDAFGDFVSCLIFIPKDVYTTSLRLKVEKLIGSQLNTQDVDVTTFFSESRHARAHMVFRLPKGDVTPLDVDKLEAEISSMAFGWQEHLKSELIALEGDHLGNVLFKRYHQAFSTSYIDHFDAKFAIKDIQVFETLSKDQPLSVELYQYSTECKREINIRLRHRKSMLALSDVIPILENFGLRVLGEQPFSIVDKDQKTFWIHDFRVEMASDHPADINKLKCNIEEAFVKVWFHESDNDAFNKLVVSANLDWKSILLLRAYAHYMKQTLFHLSTEYIADTLVSFPHITHKLLKLFSLRFDPTLNQSIDLRERDAEQCIVDTGHDLEEIKTLSQDQVFRRYLDCLQATLRTSYYCHTENTENLPFLSLKISPRQLSDIPEPKPLYEFFVYSSRVEGVHLRTSKVARGGLRWSDRLEDYRTEVLGLVKAQHVKNAVIVPSGAKGGFVGKQLNKDMKRAQYLAEGVECYKLFIRGLLELTDNSLDTSIVKPSNVVCWDDDDPYLVVAADKGTATFSDIANEISIEKGHWLGDAFASGGSQGYDHKAMGITAKGAWVSVQRHFRELGVNVQQDAFTVVGIGDMAGDVFGNGMLLSNSLKLVSAFNHLHIFIDPSPDAELSFQERSRLFTTAGSAWTDYNSALISEGGGVFSRSEKYIYLTPQIQALIDCDEDKLTPNALISALLKSSVDLIWNGGIGTYVKSSSESHAEVGDKANDALRVNGCELRCRVFGEGGNLGLTQLGRIEYAANQGRCNTDFIDNAAGVDCSDHEVNIKILIDTEMSKGALNTEQRNRLLRHMTDNVSELVLKNNYHQTLAISIAEQQAGSRMNEYRRFITYLEQYAGLQRDIEYLPSDHEIKTRTAAGKALTRPELSVLISYAKVQLKQLLADSNIAKDAYCARSLFNIFPEQLQEHYTNAIHSHKLRCEIIATQLANNFINCLGITALQRLTETTSSNAEDVIKAFIISRDVFELESFIHVVAQKDYLIDADQQYRLISNLVRRVRRGTRWFLKNRRSGLNVEQEVHYFLECIPKVHTLTGRWIDEAQKEVYDSRLNAIREMGFDDKWAERLAMPENLFSGVCIAEITRTSGASVEDSVEMFLTMLYRLKLDWFATQLSDISVENYWQASARETYIDDLEAQLRKLSTVLLKVDTGLTVADKIDTWFTRNADSVTRWNGMIAKVESNPIGDYAMFSVALRELHDLVQITVFSPHYSVVT